MRFNSVTITKDTMPACYALVFDNGLVLKAPEILWVGKDGRERVKRQLEEVLAAIDDRALYFDPNFQLENKP